jgi:cell filamentation protein
MAGDPYVYPETDVLRNRFGVRDAAELARREADATLFRLAQLHERRLPGDYDLRHLRSFHRQIFQDVYDWAGELRTVPVGKEQSLFALPEHIESYLNTIHAGLARERHLRGLDTVRFGERLAHYFAEVNAVHPFRDGNGRTQRAFFGQLAEDAGYRIAWERLDRDRNVQVSRASHHGDEQPLRDMLDELIEPSR